ncbi:unnamed protein product [Paramecium sonneborni]|uniref:Uncharacterized protein n=1 Tax=Paramecium sonneborni TaxID=65129 RepID=A0A8S1R7I4_9CILI|nr:unnamed protein product [Paramecium sonneborni]
MVQKNSLLTRILEQKLRRAELCQSSANKTSLSDFLQLQTTSIQELNQIIREPQYYM